MGWNHDPDGFHSHQSGEIQALTEKTTPVDADVVVIEDSEDSWAKKKVALSEIGTGGGGGGAGTYSEIVGDTTETSFDIEHGLDTDALVVGVIELSSGDGLVHGTDYTWLILDADTVRVVFNTAPATDDAQIVVLASGGTSSGGGGGGGLLGEVEASTDVNFLELEIPSGATDVRITGLLRVTVNAQLSEMYATVGNGTVDTGSNYKWGYRWKSNSSTGSGLNVTDSKIDLGGGVFPGASSPAGVFAVLDMLIPGYDDTTRDKFVSWTVRKWRADSGTRFVFAEGWAMWDSTAAVDVIRFTPQSDQIAAGSVIRAFAG